MRFSLLFVNAILILLNTHFVYSQVQSDLQSEDSWEYLIEQTRQNSEQGDYYNAIDFAQRALISAEKKFGVQHRNYAESHNDLGFLYYLTGSYDQAESHYLKALEIKQTLLDEQDTSLAVTYLNFGSLYREMGRFDKSESMLLMAAEVDRQQRGENDPLYADDLHNLGYLYYLTGRFDEAEHTLKQALEIKKNALGEINYDYAGVALTLATFYSDTDRLVEAEELFKDVIRIDKIVIGEDHPEFATDLNNLALLYDRMHRYEEAVELMKQSLEITKNTLGETHPYFSIGHNNIGGIYIAMGEYASAEEHIEIAQSLQLQQLEDQFPALSENEKKQYWQTLSGEFEKFHSFVNLYKDQNPSITSKAYNNTLATKAMLLDASSKIRKLILNSGNEDLIQLYKHWSDKRQQLADAYSYTKIEQDELGINMPQLKEEINRLEKQLSSISSDFHSNKLTEIKWQDVRNTLSSRSAAIELVRFEWFDNEYTDSIFYVAYIIKSNSQYPEMVLMKNGNELEGKYLKYNRNNIGYRRLDEVSFDKYWRQIWEKLDGIDEVFVSSDGVYNQINLNTLFNTKSGKYLLDEIDIHMVTSTRELVRWKERSIQPINHTAVLFGRPSYMIEDQAYIIANVTNQVGDVLERGLKDRSMAQFLEREIPILPGTETEIEVINNILIDHNWKINSYTHENALEEEIKKLNKPGVLHIATHGFFLDQDPQVDIEIEEEIVMSDPMLRSGLLLAGVSNYYHSDKKPNRDDGILTAYEATSLLLDNTDLVVLSACETGLGELATGEGVYGLQRGFEVAGAKTILMSLWKVSDQVTQQLMSAFYREWLKTGDKRKAFQKAQQQIKSEYSYPFFWGAFVMVGE